MDFLKLFKQNSLKYSDIVALQFQDKQFSYKELDELSNYICLLLEKNNVRKGDIIGLIMPRSEKILISILGILKYGCTFLPIDIDYPNDRIEYILKNSKITSIITTKSNLKYDGVNIIDINNLSRISEYEISNPIYPYVIYTSGSTGKPKGVLLKYEGLNNLLSSFIDILNIKKGDKFLAITTISFDISILELLLPLCVGATVVIAPSRCQIDPYYLSKTIEKHEITYMQATPVTWQMLIDSNWTNSTNVKIICGGEALSEELAKSLLEISKDVWNVYGPTETTIWSSYSKIKESNDIPIGKPINNTIFKIISNEQDNTEGELYIGGIGLAEGYLNNDDLTNDKFVFIDGIRYYKTGDIVKVTNGNYYYICRDDYQVKINGHRIELGEIENTINSIKDISNTVVIYDQKYKNLICFIIEKELITDDKIISFISDKLPSYMIPNKFIRVNNFPLTNNKKIDRKKLLENYNNMTNIQNNISSYDMIKMLIELNETKKICKQKLPYKNHEVWFMQKLMYNHKTFYPESKSFYEQITLNTQKSNIEILSKICNDIKNNLDIFKIGIKRVKGKYVFINDENNMIKLAVKDNKIIIDYHNCIIDGESINILIDMIINKLNNIEIDYEQYNGFINDIELLNKKLKNEEPKHIINKIFSDRRGKKTYRKNIKIKLKSVESFAKDNSIKISETIQYVFCKSLLQYSKENINFGIVNSNRNFTNSIALGNFINIVHQEYDKEDLNDITSFTRKCFLNKKYYFSKYNENNDYEILLIINNTAGLSDKLQKNNFSIEMGDYVYENNNSPINFKCNINNDILDIYISAKNISNSNKLIEFIATFEENIRRIK